MTSKVATITYGFSDPIFTPGTVVDHVHVVVTDSSQTPPFSTSQDVADDTAQVSFDLPPGNYTITAQGVDASNNMLGTAASTVFIVPTAGNIALSLPVSIAVA